MDESPGIEFVDGPPETGRGQWDRTRRKKIREFAAELKKHPGQWAIYPIPSASNGAARAMASRISNGRISAFASGFWAVSRNGVTYVQYEGK